MAERRCMRRGYGQALVAYGEGNPDLVVLDADASSSTMTSLFAERFPGRFYNLGIAEAGMVDVAVGLALGGHLPFVNTFAPLLTLRACEQIRTCVAYAETNVKLVGCYAGLSDFKDGATHHSITDLATMRALPNMTVMVAADAVEVATMVPVIAKHPGPAYLRVSRAEVPVIFDETHVVEVGRGVTLRQGRELTLIAMGLMIAPCLEAAGRLAEEGVEARVLEIHTLKPIDDGLLCRAARETGAVVTAEEHSIIGGLGGVVAEVLGGSCPVPVVRVGVKDVFSRTAPDMESLLEYEGLGVDGVLQAARSALRLKQ